MSAADLDQLSGRQDVIVSGVVAAAEFGELVQPIPGEADLYVSAELHDKLGSVVAAVLDQLGGVVIRAVHGHAWPRASAAGEGLAESGRYLAPRSAVALDLMESGDPRHWLAAENLSV